MAIPLHLWMNSVMLKMVSDTSAYHKQKIMQFTILFYQAVRWNVCQSQFVKIGFLFELFVNDEFKIGDKRTRERERDRGTRAVRNSFFLSKPFISFDEKKINSMTFEFRLICIPLQSVIL